MEARLTTDTPTDGFLSVPPQAGTSAAPARAWDASDMAIGSGLIVMVVALFLPWFSETLQVHPVSGIAANEDGPAAHAYLWLVFALAIVALVVVIDRRAIERIPGNLPSAQQLLLLATGLSLLLTAVGAAFRPTNFSGPGVPVAVQALQYPSTFSVGWSYGGFIAVLGAAIAVVGSLGVAGRRHARPTADLAGQQA
jgi:multisubunit Na+/H+ antiporter MnhB subunit